MPGWEQRISQREAVSLACLGTLLAQARLLIADAAMQSSTLAALAQIRKVIRRAASIHLILPPRNAGARNLARLPLPKLVSFGKIAASDDF